MSKLTNGSRVGIIENGEIVKGTVKEVYTDLGYAVVAFDSGDVMKVLLSNLAVLSEENQETKEPKEPVEKSEITITPEKFRDLTAKIVASESHKMGSPILGLAFVAIIAKIHRALFFDEEEND